jgi:hypothetical protein
MPLSYTRVLLCPLCENSGRIGEDPSGPPNNLMPYVAQVGPFLYPLPFVHSPFRIPFLPSSSWPQ